jgi:hypothetical protein
VNWRRSRWTQDSPDSRLRKKIPPKEKAQDISEAEAAKVAAALAPDTSGVLQQEADRAAMLKAGVGPESEAPAPATDGVYVPEADRAAMLKNELGVLPVPIESPVGPEPVAMTPPTGGAGFPPVTSDVAATLPPPEVPAPGPEGTLAATSGEPPGWADKISTIAKKRGRGFLDALQAGLYGFAGVDKATDYEQAQAQEAKAAERAQDQAFAQMMGEVEQKNADRRMELEHNFQKDISEARNRWDSTAAERGYEVGAEQSALNRKADLELAKERWVQAAAKAGKDPAEALKEFQAQLSKMYGG